MDLKENEIIVNDVLVNIDDLDEWYISSACGQQHDDDTLIYCHNIFNGSGDCVGVVFFGGQKNTKVIIKIGRTIQNIMFRFSGSIKLGAS